MLVRTFSIAVEEEYADCVQNEMHEFGIEFKKRMLCSRSDFLGLIKPVVYFDCYAPTNRLNLLLEFLENDFAGTAILSY